MRDERRRIRWRRISAGRPKWRDGIEQRRALDGHCPAHILRPRPTESHRRRHSRRRDQAHPLQHLLFLTMLAHQVISLRSEEIGVRHGLDDGGLALHLRGPGLHHLHVLLFGRELVEQRTPAGVIRIRRGDLIAEQPRHHRMINAPLLRRVRRISAFLRQLEGLRLAIQVPIRQLRPGLEIAAAEGLGPRA